MRLTAGETDTIAAIATPMGEGGLAVVRLSGREALAVADRVFVTPGSARGGALVAATHTLHYGHVVRDGKVVDEVLLAVMRAPRTFTREDVAEISCHGGVFVARQVLDAVLAAGARLALPGEFTRRAFLNGRLDLVQAEAVADLIHARTERALWAAQEQLAGTLSRRVGGLRDDLMGVLAHVEAHLDFPDEDIEPETQDGMGTRLESALGRMDGLLATAREGEVLRRGVRAAIIGRPNAGKSSLLNELVGRDRAIVSPVAGTTRDTIEATANVRGIPVVFVDTAGLRQAGDAIEEEGVRRSRRAAAHAELLLHVLDGSEPMSATDRGFLEEFAGRPRVLVLNKADLGSDLALRELGPAAVSVSCRTGEGLEALKDAIVREAGSGRAGGGTEDIAINARHEDILRRARVAVGSAADALRAGEGLELVAMELRLGVQALGEMVGKTTTEDLLDRIFGEFCLGK
ncbi:MAG: tRNA uridine-5-carboxymethylaminomethyl(34) synthesis GTPase MnmE [Verrucomicrobiae bacterium]|nr:tRNA uridine-5-carboxymethylaminomethyl(34) synthesis GTPase MnmE [Verrucomicrobiae bacterium]